jgi:hypothetical protein
VRLRLARRYSVCVRDGLAGWGGGIRTSAYPNKTPPAVSEPPPSGDEIKAFISCESPGQPGVRKNRERFGVMLPRCSESARSCSQALSGTIQQLARKASPGVAVVALEPGAETRQSWKQCTLINVVLIEHVTSLGLHRSRNDNSEPLLASQRGGRSRANRSGL